MTFKILGMVSEEWIMEYRIWTMENGDWRMETEVNVDNDIWITDYGTLIMGNGICSIDHGV